MKKTVVIGTIGADAHMIGGWILKRALSDAGFNVTYLGAVVPQDEFINAAIETNADAILAISADSSFACAITGRAPNALVIFAQS